MPVARVPQPTDLRQDPRALPRLRHPAHWSLPHTNPQELVAAEAAAEAEGQGPGPLPRVLSPGLLVLLLALMRCSDSTQVRGLRHGRVRVLAERAALCQGGMRVQVVLTPQAQWMPWHGTVQHSAHNLSMPVIGGVDSGVCSEALTAHLCLCAHA